MNNGLLDKKEVLDLIINDLKNTYLDEDNNGIKVSTIDLSLIHILYME